MDQTNPFAAPTAANPTPWRGKVRKWYDPMKLFRRIVPLGFPWTSLCVVTGQFWFAIPMYFLEKRKLKEKWAQPFVKIESDDSVIDGTARPINRN